ncbi:MAG: methyltransferase type 11 [Candidatus Rokuibacteriota bacterium]|nr:MAG: methyltransferase type 11 [Candidatus Rokubacteria bacterium]
MAATFGPREVARLLKAYASSAIAQQRARTLAALGVRPGERGLDVGCGPGFLTAELAGAVGERGRVVAVDASPEMREAARSRLEAAGLAGRVDVLAGDAVRLDFADGAFDWVAAVQVYLYVPDVPGALAEAARVLRPGGRLVVVDTDWDSCVWRTADRARHRRVMEARQAHFTNPHLPPQLPELLQAAGLRLDHAEVIPLLELEYGRDSFSGDLIPSLADLAARYGVPREEADAWKADLLGRTAPGQYFFSVNRFLFRGAKPADA